MSKSTIDITNKALRWHAEDTQVEFNSLHNPAGGQRAVEQFANTAQPSGK